MWMILCNIKRRLQNENFINAGTDAMYVNYKLLCTDRWIRIANIGITSVSISFLRHNLIFFIVSLCKQFTSFFLKTLFLT